MKTALILLIVLLVGSNAPSPLEFDCDDFGMVDDDA